MHPERLQTGSCDYALKILGLTHPLNLRLDMHFRFNCQRDCNRNPQNIKYIVLVSEVVTCLSFVARIYGAGWNGWYGARKKILRPNTHVWSWTPFLPRAARVISATRVQQVNASAHVWTVLLQKRVTALLFAGKTLGICAAKVDGRCLALTSWKERESCGVSDWKVAFL